MKIMAIVDRRIPLPGTPPPAERKNKGIRNHAQPFFPRRLAAVTGSALRLIGRVPLLELLSPGRTKDRKSPDFPKAECSARLLSEKESHVPGLRIRAVNTHRA